MEKHGTDEWIFSHFPVEKQWQGADFNAWAVDVEHGLCALQRDIYLLGTVIKQSLKERVPEGLAGVWVHRHGRAATGTGDALPGTPSHSSPQPPTEVGTGGLAVAAAVVSLVCEVSLTLKNC